MNNVVTRRNAGHAGPSTQAARGRRLRASASPAAITILLGLTAGMAATGGEARAQQYWDGAETTADSNVDGGAGTWNATATNWTNIGGNANAVYAPGTTTVFGPSNGLDNTVGGLVTVDNGGGQIVLSQTVNFTATSDQSIFTIAGGALQINAAGATFNVANVSGSASTDAVISSNIVSSGGSPENLTKTGSGTLRLEGTNTYSGSTTVNGGVLEVTGGNAITDTSAVALNNSGSTLRLLADETIGSLAGGGSTLLQLNGGTLTTGGSASTSFDGTISGTGGIVKNGTGTFTLTGTNSYSGTNTINAGTLQASDGDGDALGSGAVVINGGTLNIEDSEGIGSLSGLAAGAVSVNLNQTLTINQTAAGSFAGQLFGQGNIVKNGTEVLALGGDNAAFDGKFTLNAGTLRLANGNALGDNGDPNDNTIANNGTTIDYANGVDIDESITINGSVSFNQTGGAATQSGAIGGGGSLVKTGGGTLTLAANNTYGGSTTINAGTLEAGGSNVDVISDNGAVSIADVAGARLLVSASETIGSLSGGGTTGGAVEIASGQRLTVNQTSNAVFGGVVDGAGSFEKDGNSVLALTGTVGPLGEVLISDGALSIGNGGSGGAFNGNVTNNSELIFNHNVAVVYDGNVAGSGFLTTQGAGQLTLNGDITNIGGLDLDPGSNVVIGAAGSVELSAPAVQLQADGASATLVNDGTIRSINGIGVQVVGGNGSLDLTNNGLIDSVGGTYAVELGGNSIVRNTDTIDGGSNGAIALKGGSGTITVDLQAGSTTTGDIRSFDNGTRNVTIAGSFNGNYFGFDGQDTVTLDTGATLVDGEKIINGGGGQDTFILAGSGNSSVDMDRIQGFDIGRKTGTGTFTLSSNPEGNTFQGGWSFEGGTVVFVADNQFGSTNGDFTFSNGATLSLANGATTTSNRDVALSGNAVIDTSGTARLTLGGVISGGGTLTKTGSGTLVLDRENSYSGLTQISGGTVRLGRNDALGSSAAGTIAESGTTIDYANNVFNADALQLNGQVNLIQQGAGQTGFQTGAVTGAVGAVLDKGGDGIVALNGSNGVGAQFEGIANVNDGVLRVNGTFGDTVGNTAVVNVNTGGTLGGNGTIAGSVFVNGGETNPGSSPGTLNINGNLTYSAGSTATFELNQPGTVGGQNDLIRVGGNLTLDGTLNLITTGGGPVGSGFYRLYEYNVNNAGGVLAGSFDTVTPNAGSVVYNINTTSPGQINLAVTNGEQLMQFWDGGDNTGNGIVDGGDGVWNIANTNWTGEPGQAAINGPWFGGVAVFFGAPGVGGNVTVQGPQNVQGLSFSSGPYVLSGDGIVLTGNTISGANQNVSTVFVESGVTGSVASQISGSTGSILLSKDGAGTLVLAGANSYGGGTRLNQGAIVANNSSAFGSGAIAAAAGTAIGYGNGVSIANPLGLSGAVTFDQSGGSATQAGAVSGTGAITKTGAGELNFTQLAATLTGITNAGGTLNAVSTGSVTSAGVAINAGGVETNFENRGTVSGSLASSAGSIFRLNNAGTLSLVPGSVLSGTDTINNSGIVNFGSGTQLAGADTFINSGTINAFGSSGTTGNFSNSGTINLSGNGSVNDSFTIDGNFAASGDSRLVVDLDLSRDDPSASDQLIVTGNGSGSSTTVQLNNLSGDTLTLLTNPIVIADFQGTNSADAPRATGLPRGLIAYFLSEDANGDWVLSSRVNSELIGGFAANFSTSQSLIAASLARPSSSFVSAPIQPEANEMGYSPWIRGIGGVVNNSSSSVVTNPSGEISPSDAKVGLKYAGVQGGFDIGRFNIEDSAWNVNLGVTGGYNSGSADQKSFDNKTEFNTAFIGTYVAFSRDRLFGELQARWDYTDFDVMAPDFSDKTITADTKRFSVSGSTGYAIEIDESSSFVPSVGLSYSTLDTSTIQTDLGDLAFDETTSLIGYLSGTLARTIVINDETGALTPFITGTIYNDFGDDTTSYFSDINGATAQIITDNIGTYGEVSLGLNYRGIFDETRFGGLKDLTAGVRADFTMGDDLGGAGFTGQVRLQF